MFSCKKFLLTCSDCTNGFLKQRKVSTSQILFRGDTKWKKLIDCNWLKRDDKHQKKLIKEFPKCLNDPCIQGAIQRKEPRFPQPNPEPSAPPAQPVEKICAPCVPCPPAEKDHPYLKPQCDIPLPKLLCISYYEKPCAVPQRTFQPEQPCPRGPAIDNPSGKYLSEIGFEACVVYKENFSLVITDKEETKYKDEFKKKKIIVEKINIGITNGMPDAYKKRTALVFQVSKNVMQSGTNNTKFWKIRYERKQSWENPTIGWMSTGDCLATVEVNFGSREEAIAFCEKSNLKYETITPQKTKKHVTKKRSYSDLFSWNKRTRASTK